jgi:hypothetical protein
MTERASGRDAVEYLAHQIFRRNVAAQRHQRYGGRARDQSEDTVTLPLDVARLVLACALKGMHKGMGRGSLSLSRDDRLIRDSIVAWTRRERKRIAQAERKSLEEVEGKAAKRGSAYALHRFGIKRAADTILYDLHHRRGEV